MSPNGLTMRPVSSARTWRSARRCYSQGKLEPALAQFRRGFELFDPNMQFPDWPGSHPGVQCQFYPALISWMLGYPDRSLDELRAAVRSAETLGHPLTLAQTLCWAALVHIFRHEPSAAADYAGRALRICEEQRIAQWHAYALCGTDGRSASPAKARRGWPKLYKGWTATVWGEPTYPAGVAGRCAIGERQARSGACVGRRRAGGGRKDGGSAA